MSETHSKKLKLGKAVESSANKKARREVSKYDGKFTDDCIPDGIFPIGDDVFVFASTYYDSVSVHIRCFKYGKTYYSTPERITLVPSWIEYIMVKRKVPESQEELPSALFPPEQHIQITKERKKITQLSTPAKNSASAPKNFAAIYENTTAVPENSDDVPEKISLLPKENSDWTLDEILRFEVSTNRYSPFRGSSSFIEVPKQIAETKAIINVINKKDSQCFMWSVLAALYLSTNHPNKTSSYATHLNKLNFDGISFPTPLNEVKKFSKLNDIGINIYSFEEDLKIFPLLISDIVCEKHIDLLYIKNNEFGHYCFNKSLSRLVSKQLSKHQQKTYICKRCLSAFQTKHKLLQHIEMRVDKSPARVVMSSETSLSWDAMLLNSKVAIELFTDYDALLFVENCVRGGISQCCNRYAIANNKYMPNFNPNDAIKYLMHLDANNLYGYAMSKYLLLKDFVWSDNNLTEQDILNLSDESDVGYILEVDLHYPSDLHEKYSNFPLPLKIPPPPNCKEPRYLTTWYPKQNMFSIIRI
ncbi:uncharacterized protein NPIL_678191 [Nephila pilipes]|uniref:C2H2-type domain-containing protein n=1 Tax=Nephila pilipes TaxID=299642 RepID=A0A8X6JXW8_NEPPI|nr:uncharacterized protein NPIL_678191 [Nephila pilipes]